MYPDIRTLLGDRYRMFYHPGLSRHLLRPICDLSQCLDHVNARLREQGPQLDQWSPGDRNQIARLLWVNWIYNNLQTEPIRKPVLVHREGDCFVVDCGDTRLMALDLLESDAGIKTLVTDLHSNSYLYQDWTPIFSTQDLLTSVGFAPDAVVLWNPVQADHAIDWLEIGDQSTSHHLHDEDLRISMIQHYLSDQPGAFQFDREWIRSKIDWASYDK